MLLLPGVRHAYHPLPETGWHEYWVGFNGTFFLELVEKGILSPEKVFFETGLHDSVLSHFNQIFNAVFFQHPLYQMRACVSILSLLLEVLDIEGHKDIPDNYVQIVEKAKLLMEANIFGTINMPEIAKELGVSTSFFHQIFKTYTSITPYQYFLFLKIQKAESLLKQANVSVKEAAYQLGFNNQYHFSILFKKKTGISPSNWKKFMN